MGDDFRQDQDVSNWWYILPIFLGLIGALVAWFFTYDRDEDVGGNCIIVGVFSTIVTVIAAAVWFFFGFELAVVAWIIGFVMLMMGLGNIIS